MGVNDIILLLLILCWCAFAVYAMMKKKKEGGCIGCSGCSGRIDTDAVCKECSKRKKLYYIIVHNHAQYYQYITLC